MAETFQTETIQGTLTEFRRTESKAGKKYAICVIDGEEYMIWDAEVQSMAETALDCVVKADLRWKEGSRMKTVKMITPIAAPHIDTPSVSPVSVDPDTAIRIAALRAAASAIKRVEMEETYKVVAMARELELYLLGRDFEATDGSGGNG